MELSSQNMVKALHSLSVERTTELVFVLGVELNVLDDISTLHKGFSHKAHAIQAWLDSDTEASWDKLVSGLKQIRMNAVASSVESAFIKAEVSVAVTSSSPLNSTTAKPSPRKELDTPRPENKHKEVAELARVLQKEAVKSTPSSAETKTATPGNMSKSISPSTAERVVLTKRHPPPKSPVPNHLSAAKKTAHPRPPTSSGQKCKASTYSVLCDYDGGDGLLPLKEGQSVEVLEKNSDGWWYVKVGVKEGWAPATFLEEGKVKPVKLANSPPQPAQPKVATSKPSSTPGSVSKAKPSPRKELDTPRPENKHKEVAELARVLQKEAVKPTPSSAETKTATPGNMSKSISPSTTERVVLTKRHPPPKSPVPNHLSAAKKTAHPRPPTSSGQKCKASTYSVLCDYDGGDGLLPLKKGQSVEVLEKSSDGWWYVKVGVKEGWAPASFLEEGKVKPVKLANSPPQPAQPKVATSKPSSTPGSVSKVRVCNQVPKSSTYRAAASYQVPTYYEDSVIDLVAGKLYKVLEKEKGKGWWFVTDGQKEGWVPSSYLDPA